ncbi:hypothetical protein ACFXHD_28995 [Streptomyces hydrogenans]|uniref:hypothetical protein n=1 Tax=Streptomyces hydrogenans TaxID=1873719 RepID=UPI0036976945
MIWKTFLEKRNCGLAEAIILMIDFPPLLKHSFLALSERHAVAISRARKALLLGLGSVLVAAASTLGVAHAEPGAEVVAAVTGDEMPSSVEKLGYPNAAAIQADTGALLKRGDGNLVIETCASTSTGAPLNDITIYSRVGIRDFCFDVKAKPAFLTLEIPEAYGIWTTGDPVKSTLKEADGTVTVINAPANDFTGYGEAGSVDGEGTILVELRITA